jgi:flagellar biosynthesis/type III secretory pathway M-ring protein FliF/YscJ
MESKTLIVLGAAGIMAVVAIFLLISSNPAVTGLASTNTTLENSQGADIGADISSALDSDWSGESDTVEIGEMV